MMNATELPRQAEGDGALSDKRFVGVGSGQFVEVLPGETITRIETIYPTAGEITKRTRRKEIVSKVKSKVYAVCTVALGALIVGDLLHLDSVQNANATSNYTTLNNGSSDISDNEALKIGAEKNSKSLKE
jgi:hypothetical protein